MRIILLHLLTTHESNLHCSIFDQPLVSGCTRVGRTVYSYKGGPCYRCLFPAPPPMTACQRCADSGVLGVVPGVIGTLRALEAIKITSDVGEPLTGRMLLFDALSGRIRVLIADLCDEQMHKRFNCFSGLCNQSRLCLLNLPSWHLQTWGSLVPVCATPIM